MSVQKRYPVGNERFGTVAPFVTEAFQIDFGAQTTGTITLRNYPAGTLVYSWAGYCAEACETGGSGTMQFGFAGTVLVSSSLTSDDMTAGTWIGPSSTHEDNGPLLLTSDDTFDSINGTTGCTAGKLDVFVTYQPLPKDGLDTDVCHVYVTS